VSQSPIGLEGLLALDLHDAAAGGHAGNTHAAEGCCDANHSTLKPRSHDTSRIAWAKLMARVGEEFPLECPNCGGDIWLIAFVTEPGPIRKILTLFGEPPLDGRNAQSRCSRAVRQSVSRKTVAEVPLTGLSLASR